jgi:hypothetical protein
MKRFRMFSLIFAVLFAFGLSFTACNTDGGSSGGGGNFANTNWRSSWSYGGAMTMETRLSFITSGDWALYMNNRVAWQQVAAGTYTVSGGTATLRAMDQEYGKATISGNTLTMIGALATYSSSWTRE